MSAARTIQILLLLTPMLAAAAGQSQNAAPATGTEKTPMAQEERATAPESAKPATAKRAGPAPARARQKEPAAKPAPPRRRSVQQHIGPVVPPPATQTYGPTLSPPAASTLRTPPAAAPAPVAGLPPAISPPPAQLNSCVGNFCTDASGTSYNRGPGNTAVNSQGRLCNQVGNTMQCF